MVQTLIAGLGNPGKRYDNTPHNLGFVVVDTLALAHNDAVFTQNNRFHCLLASTDALLLAKPLTYMNKSGESISAIATYYKLNPPQIFVIHDDVDLPFGHLKISQGKGPGTHNGVKSIVSCLGTDDFTRFRLGIGLAAIADLESYVLSPIPVAQQELAQELVTKTVAAVTLAVQEGTTFAMNEYNK